MNTEITWKNLSKAGFKRTDVKKWQKDNVTIEVNRGSISDRQFLCYVYTSNLRFVKALAPIDTIEQFNMFMEIMQTNLELKEE